MSPPAARVVPPFQMSDAVHSSILDGGYGMAEFRQNKHKASALFGTPPSFGWDSHGLLAWFYHGGGEALYAELLGILRLNLVGLLYFPVPTQPLGWFRKDVGGAADLRGLRFRAAGLSAEVLTALGATITALPSGDIVAAMDRGLLDATDATIRLRSSLGLPDGEALPDGKPSPPGGGARDRVQQDEVRCAAGGDQSRSCGTRRSPPPATSSGRLCPLPARTSTKSASAASSRPDRTRSSRSRAQGMGQGDRRAFEGAVLRQGDCLAEGLGQAHHSRTLQSINLGSAALRRPTSTSSATGMLGTSA